MNRKSHVIRHILILQIFSALKKLCFCQNREKVFNWLNSTNWVKLHKGHVQKLWGEVTYRDEVTCRRHASCSKWSAFTNGWSNNSTDSSIQRRCQLVIRLKVNKYYQKLLNSLSFYINLLNFLNLKASAVGFWPLAGSKSLAPDSGLRFLAIVVLVFAFSQSFLGKVCRNPTALWWVAQPWSLNWLFATPFVCDSGPLHTRSRLSLASLSSCLSGLLSNYTQLCLTVLNCPWLHQAIVYWVCRVIMHDFGRLVNWLFGFSLCKLFSTIGSSNCK